MDEADRAPLKWEIRQSKVPDFPKTEFKELWFQGIRGEIIFDEYIRPTTSQPTPVLLQLHGYPGRCRSYLEQSSFAGMGITV